MVRGGDPELGRSLPVTRQGSRRRLAAILSADIVGYSALMSDAEEATHRRVGVDMHRLRQQIERSSGRIFNVAGDGLIAEFPSAVEAVRCALRFQAESGRRNSNVSRGHRLVYRIGINAGEIIVDGDRIGGTAVNVAARLEPLADAGGVLVSAAVYEQVRPNLPVTFEPRGEQRLKNIRDPVSLYAIRPEACLAGSNLPVMPPRTPQRTDESAKDHRPSLAVLPFRMLQAGEHDAYFAEGVIDDIIRMLGGLKDLLVISRNSTASFARAPIDLRRAIHDLDADYVLHGSVRRNGEDLRIAVELADRDRVLWADRFDGTLDSVFDLQDRIALQVASIVTPHLRTRELARASRKRPENLTAFDLTLQATSLLDSMERQALARARTLLESASGSDPNYAPSYSHLASLSMRWIAQGWSDDEDADREVAARAARMAIERDPSDALGLAIYGHLQAYMLHDYATAQEYLFRAIAAGPSCAWAWAYSSLTLGYVGDTKRSVEHAERALRLSPLGTDTFWLEHYLSQAYYLSDRFREAVSWAQMSRGKVADNTSNLRCLIASLVASGDTAAAREVVQHLTRLMPSFRLRAFRDRTPLRDQARDLFLHRLQSAGVPD